jgi:hypothetical protein
MNRRGFLSVITMGAVATPAVAMGIKESSDPSDGPISAEHLSIRSGVKEKKTSNEGSFFAENRYEEYKQVGMAVGKDGNLWLKKEDGQWKRIMTE